MIRLAVPGDAGQLFGLNERFNGPSLSTVEDMERSLSENTQELVVVADQEGVLAGFVCVQVKRSFCYERPTAEITEVFVDEGFRRKGLARELLDFAEQRIYDIRQGRQTTTILPLSKILVETYDHL